MNPWRPRPMAAIGCLLFAGLVLAAPAVAATSTTTVPDVAEAWFASSPLLNCTSPIGCPPVDLPSTASYPAHTLHVGVSAGQDTARSYVAPDFAGLPVGASLVSGVMTVPVSADPNAGNQNIASATIVACLVTAPITDGVSGSTSQQQQPAVNCEVTATASYRSGSGVFAVDLAPMIAAWNSGAPEYGVSLQPAPGQPGSAFWQVSFNGRRMADVPHVATTFEVNQAVPSDTVPLPEAGSPGPSPPSPVATVLPAAAPPVVVGAAPTTGPAAIARQAPSGQSSSEASARSAGFQYPQVMLLPLAFLTGLVFVTRLLTSDATPRRRLRW